MSVLVQFELNEKESDALRKFEKKHLKKCLVSTAAVTLTETGIGLRVVVRCCVCSKVKDISDYASW